MQDMNEIASKSLGSSASYAIYTDKFDSTLLNPMPRAMGRKDHNIDASLFQGKDVWKCYESTFLLDSGKPVSGTLKFSYDAQSEFMIESKSMKLYLNSFDMCKMGKTLREATLNYISQIRTDLLMSIKTPINIQMYYPNRVNNFGEEYDIEEFTYLDDIILDSVEFTDYNSDNTYIEYTDARIFDVQRYWTNSMRSRCRVTGQKDTGSAFVSIDSRLEINPESLFRQIVSLREKNEFHELSAEILFDKIYKKLEPDNLEIILPYSRRGSLDITPIRYFKTASEKAEDIMSTYSLNEKEFGQ